MRDSHRLIEQWKALQGEPLPASSQRAALRERRRKEVQILQALQGLGENRIPGEAFEVNDLLKDYERLWAETSKELSPSPSPPRSISLDLQERARAPLKPDPITRK
jgi:hypothetical protein